MIIEPAKKSDASAVAELDAAMLDGAVPVGTMSLQPKHEFETLVARIQGRLVGVTHVSYFSDGVRSYGMVHYLGVDDPNGDYAAEVLQGLLKACYAWLEIRGAVQVLTAPQAEKGIGWLLLWHKLPAFSGHTSANRSGPVRAARRVWG